MNKKLEVGLEGAMNEVLKKLSDYFSAKIERYYKKKNSGLYGIARFFN
jgi:hypothetical protein